MINNHVNKIILVGRVETAQVLARLNSKGSLVTNFEVKTHLQIRTGSGFVVEESCLHPVTAWGDLARLCVKNLQEGSLVYLEGRLHWGNDLRQDRTRGESSNKPWIIAEQVRLLTQHQEKLEAESKADHENGKRSEDEGEEESDSTHVLQPELGSSSLAQEATSFLFSKHLLNVSASTSASNPTKAL